MNTKKTSKKTFSILVGLLLVFEALFAPAAFAEDAQGSVMLAIYDKNGRLLEFVTSSHNLNQELVLSDAAECRVFYFDANNRPVNDEGSNIQFTDSIGQPVNCTHGLHVKVTSLPAEWEKGSLVYWCSECEIQETVCPIVCNLFTTGVMAVVNTNTEPEYEDATPGLIDYSVKSGNDFTANTFSNAENDSIDNKSLMKIDLQRWKLPEGLDKSVFKSNNLIPSLSNLPTPVAVGDTRNLPKESNGVVSEDQVQYYHMVCAFVGEYCSIWRCTDDNIGIQITDAQAEEIADTFDAKCTSLEAIFGEIDDVDNDGKLAIYCYDINGEFDPDSPIFPSNTPYTGGFFFSMDYVGSYFPDGYSYPDGTYYPPRPSCDCIHIDTYPSMGGNHSKETSPTQGCYLDDIGSAYSTLVHEGQHLINYCNSDYNMDTFLNEAMSMAAEHIIFGPDATSSRISYFNDPEYYHPGTSLTVWDGDGITGDTSQLSNYANSYLFGQYLRTRYDQINPGNGGTIFKQIIESYDMNYYIPAVDEEDEGRYDYLAVAAELLGYANPSTTGKEEIVKDFWTAVYKKEDTGKYGFNGEEWADAIDPIVFGETVSYETWCGWRKSNYEYLADTQFDYINAVFGGQFVNSDAMVTFFYTLDTAIYDGGCRYFEFDDNVKTPKQYLSSGGNVELLRFPDEN